MSNLQQMNIRVHETLKKHSKSFLTVGIVLIILGVIAVSLSTLTTLVSVVLLGVLIFIGGFFSVINSFKFWRWQKHGFYFHLIMSLVYLFVGALMMFNPVAAAASLTMLLAIFFLILGIFRLWSAFATRLPNWGWNALSGALSILIAVLIFMQWPATSLFVIGLFIGIDLIFAGWFYVMLALAARA